jgi:sugar/nucleoside kinase (ribokinase family)
LSLDTQYDATQKWCGADPIILDLIRLSDLFIPNHIELCSIVAVFRGLQQEEEAVDNVKEKVSSEEEVVASLAWLTKECPTTLICVKMGAEGAMITRGTGDGHLVRVQAPRKLVGEECVDTCGAGDCFAACLLHSLLFEKNKNNKLVKERFPSHPNSNEVIQAVEYGCRGGTWCCQQIGACVRAVTAKDLESSTSNTK